ncbi:S-adenosyl-L-methionine-dependent methyltransferase [Phyllosticta citricarpa]|uniref:tRNA(Phe) (4-demethylwyosine(37)-C(7)) aminocarboxypropyltransferase n=2 Tax=Phyllosticta TaxID=121621 RepID=A0ABR1M8L7_9PEZI
MSSCSQRYALLVPAKDVKTVKTLLESRERLDKARKIEVYDGDATSAAGQKQLLVPILFEYSVTTENIDKINEAINEVFPPGQRYRLLPLSTPTTSGSTQLNKNPLHAAFSAALSSQLSKSLLPSLSLSVTALVSALPATYLVYSPLLLLPAHAFAAPEWQTLLRAAPADGEVIQNVCSHVAKEMSVEAIAVNAAIPLGASSSSEPSSTSTNEQQEESSWNALRSPTGLTPLYGSFGPRPSPTTTTAPTPSDYAAALWVSTRQNGIAQVWAPLYTMFSRGNIREKARLLALIPSLQSPPAPAPASSSESQAVSSSTRAHTQGGSFAALDLYAGIGYFAFSYRRAGARPVLCWEINAWSIEGLRRGAAANGWTTHIVSTTTNNDREHADENESRQRGLVGAIDPDFIIFPHTNAAALADLAALRENGVEIPPILHVNGGLLPSSRGAWRTAVRAVDSKMGGWLHLHENFGAEEMQRRAEQVLAELRELWEDAREERTGIAEKHEAIGVKLVHLEKVKTYAPGVWHVVLDIWVPPTGPAE